MTKRHYLVLMVSLLLGLVLMVAFYVHETRPLLAEPEDHERYEIQVIFKARANPPDFWRIVEQGVDVAAEEFSVRCEVSGPVSESDVEGQIALVRRAIQAQPDAIVLAASDYELLAGVCAEADAAGIPLIMVDSDVDYDGTRCLVATDNYELGRKLAEQLEQLIGPDDRFGVVGHVPRVTTAVERRQGLLENVAHTQTRMAGLTYCNGSVELARDLAKEMLINHPDIKCMVGLNESSALGIAQAISDLRLTGQVQMVCCDSSQELIEMMENGTIQAFVIQNPFNMGYLSVQAAVEVLDGQAVEGYIDTGSVVVTKSDLYRKEYQKLLFPFTE